MKKINYYERILQALTRLHKMYPTYNMGRHLSTVLDEQGDVWGMTDKELSYLLSKYIKQLEIDIPHADDVEDIIKGGLNLNKLIIEDDYYNEEF